MLRAYCSKFIGNNDIVLFYNPLKIDSYYNLASLLYNSRNSTLLNYLQYNLALPSIVSEINGLVQRWCSGRHDESLGRAEPKGKHSVEEALIRDLGLFCGPGGGGWEVSQGWWLGAKWGRNIFSNIFNERVIQHSHLALKNLNNQMLLQQRKQSSLNYQKK